MMVRPGGGRECRKIRHKSSRFAPPPTRPDWKPKVNFSPRLRPITTTRNRSVRLDVRQSGKVGGGGGGGGGQEVMDGYPEPFTCQTPRKENR